MVDRVHPVDGYQVWSRTYDEPRNGLFDIDEPLVFPILDRLPDGVALDAACGTGRFAEYLTATGHQVIGVDSSPDMLERARERVPEAQFKLGDLQRLPLADDEVDVVVCALALVHVRDLEPVMAEFARVLRPGGHLVISDVHHERVFRGSVPRVLGPRGERGRIATYRHRTGDYLRAALPSGLHVRACEEEPQVQSAGVPPAAPRATEIGPWHEWPWCLTDLVPEAAEAAGAGSPSVVVWHFQLDQFA
nr:class I SAM-dependent methyltransferase [Phytoactinopolyspora alkaliphila]